MVVSSAVLSGIDDIVLEDTELEMAALEATELTAIAELDGATLEVASLDCTVSLEAAGLADDSFALRLDEPVVSPAHALSAATISPSVMVRGMRVMRCWCVESNIVFSRFAGVKLTVATFIAGCLKLRRVSAKLRGCALTGGALPATVSTCRVRRSSGCAAAPA